MLSHLKVKGQTNFVKFENACVLFAKWGEKMLYYGHGNKKVKKK